MGFRVSEMYFAYLDEFGHIGPFVDRTHPRYKESPVFGLAGFVMPAKHVRHFGTWFFQRKCQLLKPNIERSGKHPWEWEKKGASLYHAANMHRYPWLRDFTFRLFSKIRQFDGFVFYCGLQKIALPDEHNAKGLYRSILRELIIRIDQFCGEDCSPPEGFVLLLDEHGQRASLLTQAAQSMYGSIDQCKHLNEQPFHLESHRYQNLQAADWIAGLIGRMGALWASPDTFPENEIFQRYFGFRLHEVTRRSGIRTSPKETAPV